MNLCVRNIKTLASTVFQWRQDNGAFPKRLEELVPSYLSSPLTCPVSNKPYYYTSGRKGFTVYCRGKHHAQCGLGKNEPRFSSEEHPGLYSKA
jgi:hypothetical protein